MATQLKKYSLYQRNLFGTPKADKNKTDDIKNYYQPSSVPVKAMAIQTSSV